VNSQTKGGKLIFSWKGFQRLADTAGITPRPQRIELPKLRRSNISAACGFVVEHRRYTALTRISVMRTGKFSPWLWLALILDIPIMASLFWHAVNQISILLPYRSVADWASDPILLLTVAFDCLGFISIVMAFRGDRRALLFWNLCHITLGFAFNFSLSMSMAEVFSRFTSSIERPTLIDASVIAAIAAYMANRQMMKGGAENLHTANSS